MSSFIVCLLGWALAAMFFLLWRSTLRNLNKVSSYLTAMSDIYNRTMDRLDEFLKGGKTE